jgi:hypothetical protein
LACAAVALPGCFCWPLGTLLVGPRRALALSPRLTALAGSSPLRLSMTPLIGLRPLCRTALCDALLLAALHLGMLGTFYPVAGSGASLGGCPAFHPRGWCLPGLGSVDALPCLCACVSACHCFGPPQSRLRACLRFAGLLGCAPFSIDAAALVATGRALARAFA